MSSIKITIIGAGVIGTSLGLALKTMDDTPYIVGHDKDTLHTRQATKLGAFDKTDWNLINACDGADLVILAIPAGEIPETLKIIGSELRDDAVITDTATTKAAVLQAATEILPPTVHFVGGHPIVSPAGNGPEYARVDLFKHALYCLTPSPTVTPDAVKLLESMVSVIGGTSFFVDAAEHDGLSSGVNDLPVAMAVALIHGVSNSPGWDETRRLAGNLFAGIASVANGESDVLSANLLSNRQNLSPRIEALVGTLKTLKSFLDADDSEGLSAFVEEAVSAREQWQIDFAGNQLSNLNPPDEKDIERPSLIKTFLGIGRKRSS